jgi:ribosomal-protein-alanine N-acetyltransferase
MSAQLEQLVTFRPMQETDLDAVMEIEPTIYSHPWSRGNFSDSINSGYSALMMMQGQTIIGYALMMVAADEAQLLNISVDKPFQKKGFGRILLDKMMRIAKDKAATNMFLEVRVSNHGAIHLYEQAGFNEMSIRPKYYPAKHGREDAVLMGLAI